MFSNNISVIFQQKEGESLTYDTPSRYLEFYCHNILFNEKQSAVNKVPLSGNGRPKPRCLSCLKFEFLQ